MKVKCIASVRRKNSEKAPLSQDLKGKLREAVRCSRPRSENNKLRKLDFFLLEQRTLLPLPATELGVFCHFWSCALNRLPSTSQFPTNLPLQYSRSAGSLFTILGSLKLTSYFCIPQFPNSSLQSRALVSKKKERKELASYKKDRELLSLPQNKQSFSSSTTNSRVSAMKSFSQSALVVVAAMFGAAQANWGWAHLNGTDGLNTQSCGTVCADTPYKVALPTPLANPARCCASVTIAYNGINTQGTYTDICTSCPTVNNGVDGNITLSQALWDKLNTGSDDTVFLTWNV